MKIRKIYYAFLLLSLGVLNKIKPLKNTISELPKLTAKIEGNLPIYVKGTTETQNASEIIPTVFEGPLQASSQLLDYLLSHCAKDFFVSTTTVAPAVLRTIAFYKLPLWVAYEAISCIVLAYKGVEFLHDDVVKALVQVISKMNIYLDRASFHQYIVDGLSKNFAESIQACYIKNPETMFNNPHQFLNKTSRTLAYVAGNNFQNTDYPLARSREYFDRFKMRVKELLEQALSKVIFSVHQPLDSWNTFITIGSDLCSLLDEQILSSTEDLSDLHWTLIRSYIRFLDMYSTKFTPSMFNFMLQDLNSIFFLKISEEQYSIKTKLEVLEQGIKNSLNKNEKLLNQKEIK